MSSDAQMSLKREEGHLTLIKKHKKKLEATQHTTCTKGQHIQGGKQTNMLKKPRNILYRYQQLHETIKFDKGRN
ncbi:ABC transporter ATP-binding protein [Sesbania bispinosa]|nr:ABC transporter ATP-binding protein [Sesbania bispinosa]